MSKTLKTTIKRSAFKAFLALATIAPFTSLEAQTADLSVGGMMVDESLVTVKNNKLVFNGLTPEQIDDGYSIVGITDNAEKGQVKVVGESKIQYNPSTNICDKSDMFSYLITNGNVESIREVTVEILCESLAIMSSLSPDGDGRQDSFVILGIDNYPDNELVIFNDLGLEIFRKKDYMNDWDGTYQGKILPTGVYYYVFKPGDAEVLSGYLYMGDSI